MDILLFVYAAVFGLIIGSFLNCLIWRLYENETLSGRSRCRDCKEVIRWYDNIPVISYIFLRGRCRRCRTRIAWQYPLVEMVTALLFALAAWRIGIVFGPFGGWDMTAYLTLVRDWIFLASLVVIFVMDARWYVIFDQATLPAGVVILILNFLLGASWQNLLLSVTIGTGFFLLQYVISRGRWIGGGDIRLGFLLGAALGWPNIIPAIFLGYFLGAGVGLVLMARQKKGWGSSLPLGTFLAVSAVVTLFFGKGIIDWYLRLINF